MATKEAGDRPAGAKRADKKSQEVGLLEAVVRDNVVNGLGKPPGSHRIQVSCVWEDTYRVNVFVGTSISSMKVAHSFFLTADGDGKIVACSPSIKRVY